MTTELFTNLIGIAILAIIIAMAATKISQGKPLAFLQMQQTKYPIKDLLEFLIKNSELRIKLCVTLGIMTVVQLFGFVPLPGIDTEQLKSFINLTVGMSGDSAAPVFAIYTGAMRRFTILGLGMMPFMSACGLIQLASIVIPPIRKAMFQGEIGRRSIVKITYVTAIVLSVIQSFFIGVWLNNPARFGGMDFVAMDTAQFRIMTVITLTASVVVFLYLAQVINRYGVGNGIAMLVTSGLIVKVMAFYVSRPANVHLIIGLFVFTGMIGMAFILTFGNTMIRLKSHSTQQELSLPVRVSWLGTMPISIAASLSFVAPITATNGLFELLFVTTISLVLSYFYFGIVFKPKWFHEFITKYGYSLTAIGNTVTNRLSYKNLSLTILMMALIPILVTKIPRMIMNIFGLTEPSEAVYSGLTALVFAGIFVDVLKHLEFLYEKNNEATSRYEIAYVAQDEIEAVIKAQYLSGKGVNVLIEPLRYSWGIPIRTAIDEYRIYADPVKKEEVRRLLNAS